MKKAVQFGAGNIGRGFTGQLFTESGYEVVFVDVVSEVVDLLNGRRGYTIRYAKPVPEDIPIRGARAVNGRNLEAVSDEISDADLLCTAVGVNVLPAVAPGIAQGIRKRADRLGDRPLNIIICENLSHASEFLCEKVKETLPAEYHAYLDRNIGFVESVVARMVPIMTEEQKREDPLLIVVEPYKILPVDRAAWIGEMPEIVGVQYKDNFQGYVDRKLFGHNMGHAISAYLGHLRGYEYIYQSMRDVEVFRVTRAAMMETGAAMIRKWDFVPSEHEEFVDDLLERFGNEALGDQVTRVGKDLLRKLGPADRLIGGARLCVEQGVRPDNVCKGIAAALLYDEPTDPTAPQIQARIREGGFERVLTDLCGLDGQEGMIRTILDQIPVVKKEFSCCG
ncbi:MAG: mannitol-1-phosphate 5-dehydrogenase [Armatimonadota bacterium]|nr:mannitol-1-phosphate 5-dehydrogenase [Armatimonadota bacterium]